MATSGSQGLLKNSRAWIAPGPRAIVLADEQGSVPCHTFPNYRAGEGVRTLDIQLGKLMLCQLSYARLQKADDVRRTRPLRSVRGASHFAKYIAPLDCGASMQYTVARKASRAARRPVPSRHAQPSCRRSDRRLPRQTIWLASPGRHHGRKTTKFGRTGQPAGA